MSLPPPAADQAYCDISAIDSGRLHMLLGQLVDIATVDEMTCLPCLVFVLRHSRTRETLLFDLGIRPDPEHFTGAGVVTAQMGMILEGRDVAAALEKGGLPRTEVKHIAISHIHFDHTGVPSAFPNATFLLGAAVKPIIETQGPDFKGTTYAIDVPLDRTTFLDASTPEWAPIGPFARALDFYRDGSLYVVDTPGHIPGRISVLARTSADGGWVFLAGDCAHDWRLLTGEAGIAHHPEWGCIHEDVAQAQETIEKIRALMGYQRVRVLLAHDKPFVNANGAGGKGYWPDKIESL